MTTFCNGIHRIYIGDDKKVKLDDFVGKFVHVRYRYVEKTNFDVKCIKAPCGPVTEISVVIHDLAEVSVSENELRHYKTVCSPLPGVGGPSDETPHEKGVMP